MSFELSKETFDRYAHKTGSAKAGHVREDVRRIQPLFVNLDVENFHKRCGNFVHCRFG